MNLSLIRKMTEYPLKTRHIRKPMPPSNMVSINQALLTFKHTSRGQNLQQIDRAS